MKTGAQIKSKVNYLAKTKDLKPQEVFQMYFFERILERLEKSDYSDSFIIKGGLLIASLIGIESRTTMDLDATVKGIAVNKESITKIIKEIIQVNVQDRISFSFENIAEIREKDDYEHYRISLIASLDKIKNPMKIDITTGDAITPKEQLYEYPLMFDSGTIRVMAYPLETILAEKLETIIRRNIATTRMRDYYDIYVLYKIYHDKIDLKILNDALKNTTSNRESKEILNDHRDVLQDIKEDSYLKNSWDNYLRDNKYVGDLEFLEVMDLIESIFIKLN